MPADLLVLPSPLLPASAYDGLADAFRRLGREVTIARATLADGEDVTDLVARWRALAGPGLLVVAHSNAGLSAPVVRDRSAGSRLVFVDAALPPESGSTPLAPESLLAHVASLADEHGVLPPWTRWWPREDLVGVIPEGLFDELDRCCPRLPLSYFGGRLTTATGLGDDAQCLSRLRQDVCRGGGVRTHARVASRGPRRATPALPARPGHRRAARARSRRRSDSRLATAGSGLPVTPRWAIRQRHEMPRGRRRLGAGDGLDRCSPGGASPRGYVRNAAT